MTLEEEIKALKRIANFHKEEEQKSHWNPEWEKLNSDYEKLRQHRFAYTISSTATTSSDTYYVSSDNEPPSDWLSSPWEKPSLDYQHVRCLQCKTIQRGYVHQKRYTNDGEMYIEKHVVMNQLNYGPCSGGNRTYIVHRCRCTNCGDNHWALNETIVIPHRPCDKPTKCYCHCHVPKKHSYLP